MKKSEVLKYCDKKSIDGFLIYKMLFEMYNDNEDIPEDIIKLVCYKPQPKEQFIIMGSALQERVDIAVTHWTLQQGIEDDLIN